MIIKKDDGHVFVMFGFGTVKVILGAEEDRGPNYPTDVVLCQQENPQPIGVTKEHEEVCSSDFKDPVILRFMKAESVDVVISALEKVKASLIENPITDKEAHNEQS